ncbi:MAG: acetoin utilization protein AcuB, partial [Desulfobacterales bacterium]
EGSGRFIVLVKDRIGVVAEVSRLLKDQEISIQSLVTWPVKNFPKIYQLIMRVAAEDKEKAISVLTDAGFKILTEYIKDLTPLLPAQ